MEYLRALLSGPDTAAAGLTGSPAPAANPAPASARFEEALFEEGERFASGFERRELATENGVPDSEISFGDFLDVIWDVINPLQHIPIIGNIYRSLTGDTISGPARVAGAALYGGPIGMLAGIVNAIAAEISGDDLGGSLIASIMGESPPDDTLVAEAPQAAGAPEPAAKPAPPAVSFVPQPRTGVLTGDAALSALLGDLRAEPEFPMELPGLAPAFRTPDAVPPPRGEDRRSAGARPARASAAAGHGFSERMMLGMDKYRALAIERGGAGRPALDRLDRQL